VFVFAVEIVFYKILKKLFAWIFFFWIVLMCYVRNRFKKILNIIIFMYFQVKNILKYNHNLTATTFRTSPGSYCSRQRLVKLFHFSEYILSTNTKDSCLNRKIRIPSLNFVFTCGTIVLFITWFYNTKCQIPVPKTHYCGGLRERKIKRHVEEHFSKFPWKYGHV